MTKDTAKLFLNKEVQIYPGDTDSKFGTVVAVDDLGITFMITESNSSQYKVGKLHFIGSDNLTMREL
jgi:hypothetical protein